MQSGALHKAAQIFILLLVTSLFANVADAANQLPEQKPLILAVHPYLTREEIISRFTPLADYIGRSIGQPLEVRVGRDYSEHIDAIGTGTVDIAYMGPASYVKLVDKYGKVPLLARQEVEGQPFLIGEIIVRQDSPLQTLADLKGKHFAFGDPDSTMGTVVPERMLLQAGVPLSSLASYKYLVGHDNVALAVLAGDYDAGAVKEEVFQQFAPNGLRALAQTPLLADYMFVASKKLPTPLIDKLRQLFLELDGAPANRAVITAIHPHMARLVPAKDSDHDNLRVIMGTKAPARIR
jgi:phosphonate transport system substrate-binding protein